MDWAAPVNIYCERIGPGLWVEPLNVVTNAGFFITGIWIALRARAAGRLDAPIMILCTLTMLIGVGSSLFHFFAQRWAGLTDTVLILLFVIVYLCVAGNRLFGLAWAAAIPAGLAALTIALPSAFVAATLFGPALNGSEGYAPVLTLIVATAALLRVLGRPGAREMALTAALFAVSLASRTLDPVFCSAWPHGLHFIWHLLNAVVIGMALLILLRHGHKLRA